MARANRRRPDTSRLDWRRPFDSGAAFSHWLSIPFHKLPGRMAWAARGSSRFNRIARTPPQLWSGDATRGEEMLDGHFTFGEQRHSLDRETWKPAGADAIWLSNFHSFSWLNDLRAVGDSDAREACVALITSWINHNRRWRKPTWRADVVGERLTQWVANYNFFQPAAKQDFEQRLARSIAQQAHFLVQSHPTGLVGAPRFTAIKGLFAAAVCLDQAGHFRERGRKHLINELKAQILPDYSLISRSPFAAALALRDLVDIRGLIIASDAATIEGLNDSIYGLAAAVRTLRTPDGAMARMNGPSQLPDHVNLGRLLARVDDGDPLDSLPHAGYFRMAKKRSVVLVDAGKPPSPPHDLTHGAGLGAFLFYLGKQAMITNCGQLEAIDQQNFRLRFTAAHSTLIADDSNSLALRPRGGVRPFTNSVTVKRSAPGSIDSLLIEHKGGVTLGNAIHSRRLQLEADGEMLEGRDTIEGFTGEQIMLRFHLHPDVKARFSGQNAFLRLPQNRGWHFHAEGGALSVTSSVYVDGNRLVPSQQITVQMDLVDGHGTVNWRLAREGRAARQNLS